MVNTNELLSIAFSLITSFTNVVNVPPQGVPHSQADLTRIGLINPTTRFDLWLVQREGYEYWIRDGVLQGYASPDSFFRGQGLDVPVRLRGRPTLSSNQVVELATGILGRLGKTGNPAEKIRPTVETARQADLPFYLLTWPVSTNPLVSPAAEMEIDARDGRVVDIHLWAQEYYAPAFAREISNRVYKPDRPPPRKPPKRPGQDQWTPTTNDVQLLVPKWLNFCKRLGLDPGNQTNVAEVDWEPTFKAQAGPSLPPGGVLYKIQFRNGNSFNCVDQRVVVGHKCGDAAFVGAWADKSPPYWTNFVGKTTLKWQDLADDLNARLTRLGVSSEDLGRYKPDIDVGGLGGVNRCVVYWYESKSLGRMDRDRIKTGLLAEFDLATGQIKNLQIFDFDLLKWEEEPEPKSK